jgi:hypothetical protein
MRCDGLVAEVQDWAAGPVPNLVGVPRCRHDFPSFGDWKPPSIPGRFTSSQTAFDAQGREYSADSGAAVYLDNANSFLEQLNPGSAVDGQLVYDVPAGTQLTELELHDSPFSGGTKVALS